MAEGEADVTLHLSLAFFSAFGNAFDFIFHTQEAKTGGLQVGGPHQVWDLAREQLKLTAMALTVSLLVALPVGIVLGHRGRGELIAVALGNAGRAIPALALIAFLVAFIGRHARQDDRVPPALAEACQKLGM